MKKLIVLTALFLTTNLFGASFWETFGSPETVNPFNLRILANGPEAAYYNPALLVKLRDNITIGFIIAAGGLDISLMDKDPKYDVPLDVENRNANELTNAGKDVPLEERRYTPLPTEKLLRQRGSYDPDFTNFYTLLGGNVSFFDGWFATGLYILLPGRQLTGQTPYYPDERNQFFDNSLHFELLGDRLDSFHLTLGLAGKIARFLSLGMGFTLGIVAKADILVYVADASQPQHLLFDPAINVHTIPVISPHFGFALTPVKNLNVTGTLHMPSTAFLFDLDVDIQIRGFDDLYEDDPDNPGEKMKYLSTGLQTNYGNDPLRFALGLSYTFEKLGSYDLTLASNVLYTRWSTYKDRHCEKPLDKWKDTFKPAIGMNVKSQEREFGLDLSYYMTPVPDQTGRSNYVDNDRFGFSLAYAEYFNFKSFTLAGGISGQAQFLFARKTEKTRTEEDGVGKHFNPVIDEYPEMTNAEGEIYESSKGFQTNNPGFPGFTSKGFIMGAGIYIRILF
jgi:long-chain fatty acid transport protein